MGAEGGRAGAARFLATLGYSDAEAEAWLSGPAQGLAPSLAHIGVPSERLQPSRCARLFGTKAAGGSVCVEGSLPAPPPPARPGGPEGVSLRDVAYWLEALRAPEIVPALRSKYLRNLRAALEALETPRVTPEDIAYWLQALRDEALAPELRAAYRQSAREALRRYRLDEKDPDHGG